MTKKKPPEISPELMADVRAEFYGSDHERRDRWWATYNATLTGLYALPFDQEDETSLDLDDKHMLATSAAERAHGKLGA